MRESILNGAKSILLEAISTLLQVDSTCKYVVIGGWCPYLRKQRWMEHKGTLDVDILFERSYKKGELSKYINSMFGIEYYPSAKHPFQLLKKVCVGEKSFIYNVDLLHPEMTKDYPGMFVDHLDLDVYVNDFDMETQKQKSIVLPGSRIIFDEILYGQYDLEGFKFNLIDFNGMLLTKMRSCQNVKRPRDCYDIYVAFKSGGIDVDKIRNFFNRYAEVKEGVEGFIKYIRDNARAFDRNVSMFCNTSGESASDYILKSFTA